MRSCAPLLCLLFIAAVPAVHAQVTQPQRGPDSGTRTFVNGIEVLPLTNLPISGADKITWTRPIEGGGSVTTSLEAKMFRSSQGRIYRESHHFAQANVDPQTTLYEFRILDPISHTDTECEIATHLCHILVYRPRLTAPPLQPVGLFDQGRRYLSRESLGTQMIDGLSTIGTRETVTIQPGTIGNDQPLTESREFWYSPDLQTNIAVTRKDPRTGTQAIQLINLVRSEPDPSIFTIPANYRVEDDRGILTHPPN